MDVVQDVVRAGTVAAARIERVSACEDNGKRILVDPLVAAKHIDDGNRHLGVVRGDPAGRRQEPEIDALLVLEQALTEGIADREAREARVCSFEAIGWGVGDTPA
jgi:hypothetical protein